MVLAAILQSNLSAGSRWQRDRCLIEYSRLHVELLAIPVESLAARGCADKGGALWMPGMGLTAVMHRRGQWVPSLQHGLIWRLRDGPFGEHGTLYLRAHPGIVRHMSFIAQTACRLVASLGSIPECLGKVAHMLWTIFVVLLVLWLLGFSLHIAGGLIHILLVVALVILVINLVSGRRSAL